MLTCHSSSIWCPTLHRLVPQTVVFHVWTSLSSLSLSPLSLISSSFPLILSLIFIFSLSLAESLSPPTDPLPHLSLRSHSSHSALRRSTHPHSYLFYHLYVPRRMVGCLACTVFFFFPSSSFFFSQDNPPSSSSLSILCQPVHPAGRLEKHSDLRGLSLPSVHSGGQNPSGSDHE